MARKAREQQLQCDSYIHITQQCEQRDFLLNDPEMRQYFMDLLQDIVRRFSFLVLAYCIMENHIHLMVKVGQDTKVISKAMQSLAGRMAQHYNRKTGRVGHFWRERFASTLIGCARHFRNVISYIDANPLNHRGGIDPIKWRFCSYHELQDASSGLSIVNRCELLRAFRMRDIAEFVAWQRRLMDRQMGKRSSASAQAIEAYSGHLALGTDMEMRLLQRRMRKRGLFTYCRPLGLDPEGDPLWALDLCKKTYAEHWEKRQAATGEQNS